MPHPPEGIDAVLRTTPTTLLVFVDETGNEDLSDPRNPTFGRGGCAIMAERYRTKLSKPWRQLKREKLGGARRPFHATDFEQSRPDRSKILAINQFLKRPFWRFATMLDARTTLPEGVDAHQAISWVTINFLRQAVPQTGATAVALVFEASERGDPLVRRDYPLDGLNITNRAGQPIPVDGYFMPKESMEPGLEIADLIAHTSGRQRRRQHSGAEGTNLDFQHTFWHSPIPPAFISINSMALNEISVTPAIAPHPRIILP